MGGEKQAKLSIPLPIGKPKMRVDSSRVETFPHSGNTQKPHMQRKYRSATVREEKGTPSRQQRSVVRTT